MLIVLVALHWPLLTVHEILFRPELRPLTWLFRLFILADEITPLPAEMLHVPVSPLPNVPACKLAVATQTV
jgi:hypothetical protein